jgi:hypothetical protein
MHTEVKWSETRAELAKAMVAAQQSLGLVAKSAVNPHFKSRYADLATVLDAILPALNGAGISLLQAPGGDVEGNVTLTTTLLHESGEWMESTLTMRPTKADPQGVGSAITYARRYAALAVAGAAPEDDDGNSASQRDSKAASRKTYERLEKDAREAATNYGETGLETWYRANRQTIASMHEDFEQSFIELLKSKLRPAAKQAEEDYVRMNNIEQEERDRAEAAMAF